MLKFLLFSIPLCICITFSKGQPSRHLVVHDSVPNQYTIDTLHFKAHYKIINSRIKTFTEQIHKELPLNSHADFDRNNYKIEQEEIYEHLFNVLLDSLKTGHFSGIKASVKVVFYEKLDSSEWQENIVVYEWHLKDEKHAKILFNDLNRLKKISIPYEISVFYDWRWFSHTNKVYFIGYVPMIDGGGDLYETVFKNIKKILQTP